MMRKFFLLIALLVPSLALCEETKSVFDQLPDEGLTMPAFATFIQNNLQAVADECDHVEISLRCEKDDSAAWLSFLSLIAQVMQNPTDFDTIQERVATFVHSDDAQKIHGLINVFLDSSMDDNLVDEHAELDELERNPSCCEDGCCTIEEDEEIIEEE